MCLLLLYGYSCNILWNSFLYLLFCFMFCTICNGMEKNEEFAISLDFLSITKLLIDCQHFSVIFIWFICIIFFLSFSLFVFAVILVLCMRAEISPEVRSEVEARMRRKCTAPPMTTTRFPRHRKLSGLATVQEANRLGN